MKTEDIEALKSLGIFQGVSNETFARATEPSFLQYFPAGTRLLEENQPADFLYIVLDGLVEMSSEHNGTGTVIEILEPVSLFILAAVLKNDVCLQSACCLAPARVLMIPAAVVRALMSQDAAFMTAIVFELASAYRRTLKELKNQKVRTGAERLANWLLIESARSPEKSQFRLRIEKRVLALRLGMTPENLSRNFSALQAHGVHATNYDIHISDFEALRAFASPSSLVDDI